MVTRFTVEVEGSEKLCCVADSAALPAGEQPAIGATEPRDPTVTLANLTVFGNTASCSYSPGAGDLTDVAANLGPLADAGASTRTIALLSGSPAIEAGNPVAPGSSVGACAPPISAATAPPGAPLRHRCQRTGDLQGNACQLARHGWRRLASRNPRPRWLPAEGRLIRD
jgi:hypothetical protein